MNLPQTVLTKNIRSFAVIIFLLINNNLSVYAQNFGFGFDDEAEPSYSSPISVSFGGEVSLGVPFYFKQYEFLWEELAKANLNFNISSKYIEAVTSFNLSYSSISEFWDNNADWGKANHTPRFIDEAFLRAYIGTVNIEAGLRKLSWGRADSSGPLDVTNPVDFTDLRDITDLREQKIARLMLHATWNAGNFSKLEGVFIPNFAPHVFASQGRWTPSQYSNMRETMPLLAGEEIKNKTHPLLSSNTILYSLFPTLFDSMSENFLKGISPDFPDTSSFKYFQTGLRYTTTIGPLDIGAQYYYGNLFRPNFTIGGIDSFSKHLADYLLANFPGPYDGIDPNIIKQQIYYTRYHQFGLDYAQVLFGFNVRAELAFNLTEDYNGSDPALQNPFLAWSLGFDRDLIWGINLNIQCNETIRLFNGKIGDNPVYDCEAATNPVNTRLTFRLAKNFLRDALETMAVIIWDIENKDCYLIPSVSYIYRDFIFNVTAGFFLGNKDGELGQYYKNSFIRLKAAYKF